MRLAKNNFKEIQVCSRQFWNDTAIEIMAGEQYQFDVTGTWKDLTVKTDADGYSNLYMSLFNKLKRSKENKWFALMGSLDQSGYFLIGKTNEVSFNQTGKLYCFANDVRGFYWNNSGSVTLKVTRIN
jgi:hypothetical protein